MIVPVASEVTGRRYRRDMRRAALSGCLAAVALGAFAPAASANIFQVIVNDYKADGQIDACRYTPGQLNATLGLIPSDAEQYIPGLREQVQNALQTHTGGGCEKQPEPQQEEAPAPAPAAPPPIQPAAPEPQPVVVPPPPTPREPVRQVIRTAVKAPPVQAVAASAEPVRGADAPAPVWLLAALAGAAVAAGLLAVAMWFFGWSAERWTRPLAASAAEAGGRSADLAGEFWDWLRLGR